MKIRSIAVREIVRFIKALLIPVGMWVIFAILTGGKTATTKMLLTTLRQSVSACIICYGLILNISLGMINLSAGAMMLFAGIVGGNIAKVTGGGIPVLVIFCILICVAEGAVTGLLYNLLRVPCIVLTIGMMLVWESFPKLIYPTGLKLSTNLTYLSRSPYCFIVLAVMMGVFYIIYDRTAFGHNLRALGSNQAIANSVGLDSDKNKFLTFIISAIFFGVGAVIYISTRGEVRNVSTMGSMSIMMDGFIGMFIAMFIARYANMSIAILFGTFAMTMMSNGFVALGLSATLRDIVQGIFLLVLLVISANSGLLERRRADKLFKQQCLEEAR